jgi:hypothetical protein
MQRDMNLVRISEEQLQRAKTLSGQRVPFRSKIGNLLRQMTKLNDNLETVGKEL